MNELSDEQVDNWRKIIALTIGPYALIMPVKQVQLIRDSLQEEIRDKGDQMKDMRKMEEFVYEKPEPEHKPFKSQEEFDAKNNWFQKALKKGDRQ